LTSQQYAALSNQESLKQAELEKLIDRQAFLMAEMNSLDADIVREKNEYPRERGKSSPLWRKKGLNLNIPFARKKAISPQAGKSYRRFENRAKNLQETEENLSLLQQEEEEIRKSEALRNQSQAELQEMESLVNGEEESFLSLRKNSVYTQRLESQG
jgi:cell division protein FtsB